MEKLSGWVVVFIPVREKLIKEIHVKSRTQ